MLSDLDPDSVHLLGGPNNQAQAQIMSIKKRKKKKKWPKCTQWSENPMGPTKLFALMPALAFAAFWDLAMATFIVGRLSGCLSNFSW